QVLKEAAFVVLALNGHSQPAPDTRIDTVSSDQVAAANQFLFVVSIAMRDSRDHAVRLQSQVLKCRVVFDSFAEMRARVIANEGFRLALAVSKDAVIA